MSSLQASIDAILPAGLSRPGDPYTVEEYQIVRHAKVTISTDVALRAMKMKHTISSL
jgi:hypothetical protein